jgi:hypothetical protein
MRVETTSEVFALLVGTPNPPVAEDRAECQRPGRGIVSVGKLVNKVAGVATLLA